jgi:ATP-dependent helicase STH1/SNF2
MLARARNKLNIDEKVIQAGKFDNKSTAQEREAVLVSLSVFQSNMFLIFSFLQRQLIEGDQDDAEESSILTLDEMNEILARSEEEANLFHQIDKDIARENEQRAAAGGYTTDLITVEELPEIYRSDQAPRLVQEVQAVGRGHRKRNNVVYEENLTELDFIKVCAVRLSH